MSKKTLLNAVGDPDKTIYPAHEFKPVTFHVPAGMQATITINIEEDTEEPTKHDHVQRAFRKAEYEGTASVPVAEPRGIRKFTGLDVLRMRGTPTELIYSALLARDTELAQDACRTTVLEYLYEKLIDRWPETYVKFVSSKTQPATLAQPLTVHTRAEGPIADDGTALILRLIEETTDDVANTLRRHIHPDTIVTGIHIVTDWSFVKIEQHADAITITADIPLFATLKNRD